MQFTRGSLQAAVGNSHEQAEMSNNFCDIVLRSSNSCFEHFLVKDVYFTFVKKRPSLQRIPRLEISGTTGQHFSQTFISSLCTQVILLLNVVSVSEDFQ